MKQAQIEQIRPNNFVGYFWPGFEPETNNWDQFEFNKDIGHTVLTANGVWPVDQWARNMQMKHTGNHRNNCNSEFPQIQLFVLFFVRTLLNGCSQDRTLKDLGVGQIAEMLVTYTKFSNWKWRFA